MPAKRKTTQETRAALRRLFAASEEREVWPPLGMERTPGYTIHRRLPVRLGPGGEYRNPEPVVWVLRKQVRVRCSLSLRLTGSIVLPELWPAASNASAERRRREPIG